ncbi:MAG: prepilin-type N-terminal cleavage/methylation domain-containing protein [Oscillospiraceae bacterium]|nr:prepilin-type N-terminal cleavage/methylation domain-containing protein [Oscillospiraceae bacterium]
MKRLFSKKSGFTLVEIIIAFAIFAIMASMIIQVLHLTIRRKEQNHKYEQTIASQEQMLIAKGKTLVYDSSAAADGTLSLQLKDKDGQNMPMDLNYQLRSSDGTVNDKNGLNYIVGNMTYDEANGEITYTPSEDHNNSGSDPNDIGGGSQMDRFDTRITATRGITSIKIAWVYNSANDEYTVTVTVDDSNVADVLKSHSQVTLNFGEGVAGGKLVEVKEVNGGSKSQDSLKVAKPCGKYGVNINCNNSSNGFANNPVIFTVKLKEKVNNLDFGDNTNGGIFTPYKGNANIYGAYEKPTTSTSTP